MTSRFLKAIAIAASAAAFYSAGPAFAADLTVAEGASCPKTISSVGRTEGIVLGCSCPANQTAGSVWGTGPYTADSDICGAATHSGVIGAEGGPIWVKISGPQDSFEGSEANGVTSRSWGSFDTSLTVLGKANVVQTPLAMCPPDARQLKGEMTCQCTAEVVKGGSVWGSGTYTEDSAICRAALHAGVVKDTGGSVTVRTSPGRDAYQGSAQNGVNSLDYGSWGASFEFVR